MGHQPLVLAIEPDLRQAAIVKRIVREKVQADVAVVDSRDAAIEAMRTTMPDVLLLSALMSPCDEDELIAHLRTLEHADHLQTHTIPQLASALGPTERRSRGLLSAFRRVKEPEAAPAGCDPDLFAEEIRVFLQRAADKKRERSSAGPDAPTPNMAWRAAQSQKTPPAVTDTAPVAEAEPEASSSWSSPFEWKPTNSSPNPSSLMAHLTPPAGIPTVANLANAARVEELPPPAAPIEAAIRTPEPTTVTAAPIYVPEPIYAPEPIPEPIKVAEPVYIPEPVYIAEPIRVPEPVRVTEPVLVAAPIQDSPAIAAPKIQHARSVMRKSVLGIRDQRLGVKDVRLGTLASWARSENRGGDAEEHGDDLRGVLAGLAVPSSVVSVGYGRGCRIRRVRVPAGREAKEAEAVGAVILSRRLLAELRDQPQG